jgi:S-adenosylmethionine:tRNA ribosyltransferase-isomerase
MEEEYCSIPEKSAHHINRASEESCRVIAVGTTTVRTLESAANDYGQISSFEGKTSLFVQPGYAFKVVRGLLTNFHLPRSTLLMLVCAFAGLDLGLKAYEEAVRMKYRFYSYGDACLILD